MTGNKPEILRADDLTVYYGKVQAVNSVDLSLKSGEITTIIGSNGAGKSTLLAALMGLLHYDGTVSYRQQAILKSEPVERRVSSGLGLVPETRELFADMTVRDNLLLGGFSRRGDGKTERAEALHAVFVLFPRLQERQTQLAKTLSGGERQMLALGRALMSKPALLMLDEPSLGLAPLVCRSIFRTIGEMRDRGISILLVEQNARAALKIADYAYVLEGGRVSLHGPSAEIAQNKAVVESYLGVSA
jgi:branched-chain amino acid transport system ATP-binding protein